MESLRLPANARMRIESKQRQVIPHTALAHFNFEEGTAMATVVRHRNTNIVTLEPGEIINEHCRSGDIALVQQDDGWWTHFVGEDGAIDSYDAPFNSYNESLWAAKAAAEFSAAEE
ncbi:MAG: hypothetical protein V7642_2458 [Burkholderiales bacterium]